MYPYFIGSGAFIGTGTKALTAPATLHAQTGAALAATVRAAAVDFEGRSAQDLDRLLLVVSGWTVSAFDVRVMAPLRARGSASLGDVLAQLALAGGDGTVHLFANWLPGDALVAELAVLGITLVTHPLESIERAQLVSGQRAYAPLTVRSAA